MAACVHGGVCRALWNKYGVINSTHCPRRCKFYEPYPSERSERHAHWNWSMLGWTCSHCSYLVEEDEKPTDRHCRNCGWKMDELVTSSGNRTDSSHSE